MITDVIVDKGTAAAIGRPSGGQEIVTLLVESLP